jgi:hypothetical protein
MATNEEEQQQHIKCLRDRYVTEIRQAIDRSFIPTACRLRVGGLQSSGWSMNSRSQMLRNTLQSDGRVWYRQVLLLCAGRLQGAAIQLLRFSSGRGARTFFQASRSIDCCIFWTQQHQSNLVLNI